MTKICVIGAGGTGQTFATDMTLKGHEARLFDPDGTRLDDIRRAGGITLSGGVNGKALPVLCDSLEQALAGADLAVLCMVATRHEEMAVRCAPLLKPGQTLFLSAGSAGTPLFRMALEKAHGKNHGVLLGELEGNLYPCRRVAPAAVYLAWPLARRRVSALAAKDTPRLITALEGVLECVPANNILEAALNSPNVVAHLMGSLLNLGAIEKSGGEYYLYQQGLGDGVLRLFDAFNTEKEALYRRMGWEARSPMEHMRKVAQLDAWPEQDGFRGLIGPTHAAHRYITEDAAVGIALLVDLCRMAGVEAPLGQSLLHLAGALHSQDYRNHGRTLAALGWGGLTAEELNQRLQQGEPQ